MEMQRFGEVGWEKGISSRGNHFAALDGIVGGYKAWICRDM